MNDFRRISKKEKEWKAFESNNSNDMNIPFLPINLLSTSIINDEIPFVKEMRRISI